MRKNNPRLNIAGAFAVTSSIEWAVVQTLLLALECRDVETFRHSLRVAGLAIETGSVLGLNSRSIEDILIAGLLHDIGKIGLPDRVLQKAGRLSKGERGLIASHPELSANILAPLPKMDRVREIILQHHERYDGTGYPGGRRGEEIIIEGRVLAVSDSFDALCTSRPYRNPLTAEEAIGWIESEVGRQFCPVSFQALVEVLESGRPRVRGIEPSDIGLRDSESTMVLDAEILKIKLT